METSIKTRLSKKKLEIPSFLINNHSYLWLSFLGILVYGIICYWPSLHYAFQFDDVANITRQFNIRHQTFWTLFMTGPRWMSYWLNTLHYKIGKFDPFSYRLGNLIIHLLNSLLLFVLLKKLLVRIKNGSFFNTNALSIALMSAACFLLHPVQTQTVSYVIQGQLEGMACLFSLIALLAFFCSCRSSNVVQSWLLYGMSCAAAFLGTGCKEIVIVLPVLTLLIDWFFIAQTNISCLTSRWYKHCLLFGLIGLLYVYFLKASFFINFFGLRLESPNNIGNILTHNNENIYPLPFFISQFKVMLHYLHIFVWPFGMSVEYDWKLARGFFSPDCIFPFMGIVLLLYSLYSLLAQQKNHPLAFGILWFLVSVLPRSSIIPSSELMSDYKTYLPSVGICFIISCALNWCVMYFFDAKNRRGLWQYVSSLIFLCIVGILGLGTYHRNKVWRTAEEFWFNILINAPQKARAYNNYAVALSERGAYQEAIPFFERAIAMDNRYPDPLNNAAVAYSIVGQEDKAIQALKQSIQINPAYPEAYNNLASLLIKENSNQNNINNNLEVAKKLLDIAVNLRPHYGKAYFNQAKICLIRSDYVQAQEYLEKACFEADFDNEIGFKAYADLSAYLGKFSNAITGYEKLIHLAPSADNVFCLANAYFMDNQLSRAIVFYERAALLAPHEGRYYYSLGEAYVKAYSFEKALQAFNKADALKASIPTLCLRKAYCCDQLGRFEQALAYTKEALEYPNLPAQHRMVAQSIVQQASSRII